MIETEFKPHAVRLIRRFALLDGFQWRDFAAGQVVRDAEIIAFLLSHDAPIEPIAADTPQQGA